MSIQTDILSETPYFLPIDIINGIKLTPREIDIIACILGRRTAKKIASFLSISPKTVENHIRNIMQKLECNSRESIIDFIESSEEAAFLKEHYTRLVCQSDFEQSLKEVAIQINKKNLTCAIIYGSEEKKHIPLIHQLAHDLKFVGINTTIEARSSFKNIDALMKDREARFENAILYALPKILRKDLQTIKNFGQMSQKDVKNPSDILFLITEKQGNTKVLKSFPGKGFRDSEEVIKYYFSFFDILKSLFPTFSFEVVLVKLRNQLKGRIGNRGATSPSTQSIVRDFNEKRVFFTSPSDALVTIRKWKLLIFISILLIVCLSAGFISLNQKNSDEKKQAEGLIRSDLIIPAKSAFLERPELMTKIEEKLKGQEGIQTIALVGIGGTGKTTIARHFARQQQSNVIWEINAETSESLMESFGNLAYALSKTEAEKKRVKGLEEIRDPNERKERKISYVKEKLRSIPNWFLIYDNVDNFTEIQKYFPFNSASWGTGKVIITTTNSNIQDNFHIDNVIQIGEINFIQKMNLFMKIMNYGNSHFFNPDQQRDLRKFLQEIPSFPLDISIAAHYLKVTNIPYTEYLENLRLQNKDFTNLQKNMLQDASDYARTRFNILTLSLKKIIATHNDFADLLLFISILDSQNISRNLLVTYKNSVIVDNFIYNLKKYSLILTDANLRYSSTPHFSIHRNTQEMCLSHLIKLLGLENNKTKLEKIVTILESYIDDVIEKEDFLKMKFLVNHCEKFLSHNSLLTAEMKASLGVESGCLHYCLNHFEKAKQLLEENIEQLREINPKNRIKIARASMYLGDIYKERVNHEKAKDLLEQSLIIYQKHLPENYAGIARALAYQGNIYRRLCNYEKAKDLLEQSLIIYQKHLPENHAGIARALGYLGNVYRILGAYEKSKDLLEQSLVIYKKNLPENHAGIARTLGYLGNGYRILGNYKKANDLLEHSLMIYKKNLPENHTGVARVLVYLGSVHRELGNYEKARELVEQGLAIYRQHTKNNVDVAWTLVHLGNVYSDLGNYEKARNSLEHGLLMCNKHLSEDHPMVTWTLAHVGNVYKNLGDYEKAKILLEKSRIAFEKHCGKNNIEGAWALKSLGQVYFLEGNLDTGENYLRKALEVFQQYKHPATNMVLEDLSELHQKKASYAANEGNSKQTQIYKTDAVNYLKQALEGIKIHFLENSSHLTRIKAKLKKLN